MHIITYAYGYNHVNHNPVFVHSFKKAKPSAKMLIDYQHDSAHIRTLSYALLLGVNEAGHGDVLGAPDVWYSSLKLGVLFKVEGQGQSF